MLVGTLTPPRDEIFKNLPKLCFDDEIWEDNTLSEAHKGKNLNKIKTVLFLFYSVPNLFNPPISKALYMGFSSLNIL